MPKIIKKYNLLFALIIPSLAWANSTQEINTLVTKFMQQNEVPGVSIAVISNHKIATYNYGYANEITHTKTSDNTIYRIASFSKTYAATLEALAQVEGKINLNNSILNYLPELSNNRLEAITPKMLLAHVASFPFDFNPSPQNYIQAINDLNKFSPPYAPGSEYSYSNVSIGLNAYILQNVYHQSYDTILHNQIAKPLKLNATYLNLPYKLEQYVALGHQDNQIRPYDRNIDVWFAASSLKSNIKDMAKFLNAQINHNFADENLSQALDIVHTNYYCFANNISCEQLGWQAHIITELKNSTGDTYFKGMDKNGNLTFTPQKIISGDSLLNKEIFIDKTCSGYGMSGYMLYAPKQKVGVVILLNKAIGDARIRLGRDILQLQLNNN